MYNVCMVLSVHCRMYNAHDPNIIYIYTLWSTILQVEVMKCLSETDQQDMYLAVATSQSNKLECTATVLQV